MDGARSRLRPILMTSLRHDRRHGADGAGRWAKAASRRRRWAGPSSAGLSAATLTTLLVLPAVFAVVQRRSSIPFHLTGPQRPGKADILTVLP